MKIPAIITILLLAIISASGSPTQPDSLQGGGYLTLKEHTINVGAISGDSVISATFILYNTGSEPVTITRIATGCSCMVPKFTREPIAPGDSASFDVTYDPRSYRWGRFRRTFTIRSTASNKYLTAVLSGTINRKYVQ